MSLLNWIGPISSFFIPFLNPIYNFTQCSSLFLTIAGFIVRAVILIVIIKLKYAKLTKNPFSQISFHPLFIFSSVMYFLSILFLIYGVKELPVTISMPLLSSTALFSIYFHHKSGHAQTNWKQMVFGVLMVLSVVLVSWGKNFHNLNYVAILGLIASGYILGFKKNNEHFFIN